MDGWMEEKRESDRWGTADLGAHECVGGGGGGVRGAVEPGVTGSAGGVQPLPVTVIPPGAGEAALYGHSP